MSKQYTFKTTRDTEWLESIIDGLPPSDRSRTIRMALTIYFDDSRPAVTHKVTPVTHKVTPPEPPRSTQSPTTHYTPETTQTSVVSEHQSIVVINKEGKKVVPIVPVIEAQDEDLDAKLNNLFD